MYALATKLMGVWHCLWNAERFIVFHTVILQRAWHVTSFGVIRRKINIHLDAWEAGEFGMIAEDMAGTCAQYLSTRSGEDTSEHHAKIFYSLVLRNKLHLAVYWINNKYNVRVFHLGDICPNPENTVLEVLQSMQPYTRLLLVGNFKAY